MLAADTITVELMYLGQYYVYRCEPGQEHRLIMAIAADAADIEHPLDWFSAGVLATRLGKLIGQRLLKLSRRTS